MEDQHGIDQKRQAAEDAKNEATEKKSRLKPGYVGHLTDLIMKALDDDELPDPPNRERIHAAVRKAMKGEMDRLDNAKRRQQLLRSPRPGGGRRKRKNR